MVYNLCYGLSSKGYEINLLAGANSLSFGGITSYYKIYRYGKMFLGESLIGWNFRFKNFAIN